MKKTRFTEQQIISVIQIISLFFELTGLALFLMELKFPKNRNRLEQKVEILINNTDLKKLWSRAVTPFYFRGQIVSALLALLIIASFLIQPLIILAPFPIYIFNQLLRFMNFLTNKKPLATIGLLIASLGLLGEIYQVILIIDSKSY
ncbi:hypothetical protein [Marinoscillum luteum]|uniref:Uncharacterized protein n=1 Tax=Marinoscillum luteum TaxID=861051 RepID=A0ABW7N5R4_9BACT